MASDSEVDEQLWVDAGEDPALYVRLLREQGRINPPHDRPIEYTIPNAPTQLPRILP